MSNFPKALEDLLNEISNLDYDSKMMMLIDFAEEFVEVPATIANKPYSNTNKIPACESEAYVWCVFENSLPKFYFAVENPHGISAKAMSVILQQGLKNCNIDEILNLPEDLPMMIFGKSLSMGKSAGLTSMVKTLKIQLKKSKSNL